MTLNLTEVTKLQQLKPISVEIYQQVSVIEGLSRQASGILPTLDPL
jgi:hypothetical protein